MQCLMRIVRRCGICLAMAMSAASSGSAQVPTRDPQRGDTAAVRRAAEAYLAALRRGDSGTLAAFWTPEGDFVDSLGRVSKGRDLVKQVSPASEADDGGRKAVITIDSIRFITSDVAIEDGTTGSTLTGDQQGIAHYTAVWVQREGQWLLDSVRESATRPQVHHERLRGLSWLVGDWVQDKARGRAELTCRWSPDGNYLLREMKVETPEGETLNVSQRIGWDAAQRQITVWSFDSDGGHGIGSWSLQGDQWMVRSTGVLPDGQTTTSTSTYTRHGDGAFSWESTHSPAAGTPVVRHKAEFIRRQLTTKPTSFGQP